MATIGRYFYETAPSASARGVTWSITTHAALAKEVSKLCTTKMVVQTYMEGFVCRVVHSLDRVRRRTVEVVFRLVEGKNPIVEPMREVISCQSESITVSESQLLLFLVERLAIRANIKYCRRGLFN